MQKPDFSTKVLSIRTIGEDSTTKLKNGRWEDQCGQLFLVGKSIRTSKADNFWANRTTAVRWDRVTEYMAFDNIAEFERQAGAPSERADGQKVISIQPDCKHEPGELAIESNSEQQLESPTA